MARNEKSRNKNNSYRPNFWGMLQNVLIAALNKGQLLPMAFTLVVVILIIKYPNDQIPALFDKILNVSITNGVFGWLFASGSTFGGFMLIRWQRRIHTKEIQRISKEKKTLQEKLAKKQLPSSNN